MIARFDMRLPKEQKQFFEKAMLLGGYRNLIEFIISAVQEKSKKIISEKEKIIASDKDSEIFFDAVVNPRKPSEKLTEAFDNYKNFISND